MMILVAEVVAQHNHCFGVVVVRSIQLLQTCRRRRGGVGCGVVVVDIAAAAWWSSPSNHKYLYK